MARALPTIVFAFEDIGPDMDLVPLAARRALDHAGLRLSLEGWRSMPVEDRRQVALCGGHDAVDTTAVSAAVRKSKPQAETIPPVNDPSPNAPPAGLVKALTGVRPLDAKLWSSLRALDRYTLVHAHRRTSARADPSILASAYDAIMSVTPAARAATKESSAAAPRPKVSTDPPPAAEGSISSHVGPSGDVRMVDVAPKQATQRRAVASATVRMRPETAARLSRGDVPKGEVLATARIAGIMAAKRTPDIVPLCHAVALTHATIHIEVDATAGTASITATAEAFDRTGVEMEALVGASVAALTIYDMLKGIDREMTISDVALIEKTGGRSGTYRRGQGEP
jgi:cyclic pyranopterin phosphate synthase